MRSVACRILSKIVARMVNPLTALRHVEYRAPFYAALRDTLKLQRRSHLIDNKAHKLCKGHDLHVFAAIIRVTSAGKGVRYVLGSFPF